MNQPINLRPPNRVPGIGPKECRIAFVGEAPGSRETQMRQPFVGTSGDLLTRMMNNAGILRNECYITNVVKEQPVKNNIKQFIDLSKRVPIESDMYKAYRDDLLQELSEVKANVIVAVGAVPLWALLGMKKITARRGSIYKSEILGGRKVIPIIHPAAALRQFNYTYLIQYDLSRILKQSEYPEVNYSRREYILEPSYIQCMEFLAKCSGSHMIAFDIEVSNSEMSCISFAYNAELAISIPFVAKGRSYFAPNQEAEIMRAIAYVLENSNVGKVGQNVIFDATFLKRKYGINSRPLECTMIGQGVLLPDLPKGLDFITSIYTDLPYYKDEGKYRIKTGGGSDHDFWLYNAKDSIVLLDAFPKIKDELQALGNMDTYKRQARLIEPLIYISEKGIRMDTEGLQKESEKAGKRLLVLEEQLYNASDGKIINPRSVKQCMDYFYIVKGIKPYVKRSTGRPTLDDNALKRIIRKGHEEASILQEIRHLSKMKSTYLDMSLDDDGRLRCNMNPVGAADSGRLSSSKTIFGTGANMQNQPKSMKKFMLADEGYIIYDVDLGQADNRCVAYVAPEHRMIEAFESGVDVHTRTATLIFQKPAEDISTDEDIKNKAKEPCPIGDGLHSERYWGKKANHSLNYGEGYKRFALDTEISEKEAKFIVESYHRAYPGVRSYHRWVEESLKNNRRILENPYGRRRKFMGRWGHELFKEAYSWIPQSTVADKINQDGLIFIYYNQQWFKDLELLNQVHDSLVFQIPISIGMRRHAEMLLRIKKSLESPIRWRIQEWSLPLDVGVGNNLGELKKLPSWGKDPTVESITEDLTRLLNTLKD